ncbi:integrating conjugative element protein (plasmid) [Vibrio azureus]|uniref:Integrating conjugative element protein n=1 Tax=Vibrio azureus NBRC 104587 TaxID=1219077 RepID=U3C439_9VIBR|nr:TIGR03749 family integrating conjugative element protein [Vibrio azureus]AUI88933.1 integrating conjugative element protein [Vibrio azureus]GAD76199.1 hypothetical protein VAZ01S_039_00240 [Vibrio azureus NBRC 104587]
MIRLFLILSMIVSTQVVAQTPRAMEWQGIPLSIVLDPHQESILDIGEPVSIAIPAHLNHTLTVSSLGGRIYLTANSDFDVARVHLKRLNSGEMLLLDVSAKTGAMMPKKVDIILPSNQAEPVESTPDLALEHQQNLQMAPEALLIRYAMQSLYSPMHAIEPLPGVMRSPMGLPKDVSSVVFAKWRVNARPIAAWQWQNSVVTAVQLSNLANQREPLDPRLVTLGGQCLVSRCQVAFSHPELGPAGSELSSVTAFIVTPGPLSTHLMPTPEFVPRPGGKR